MLTVQVFQKHRLVAMHPNKAKLFPAATVLVHRRRGKRGTRSEDSRNARRSHASKQKCRRWRPPGVVGVLHPTRPKKQGNNLGRYLELSERLRIFARKKRRGKRVMRKTTRMKRKVAMARSQLDELTFGTFNVRTAAVSGVNGIGHIDSLPRPCT